MSINLCFFRSYVKKRIIFYIYHIALNRLKSTMALKRIKQNKQTKIKLRKEKNLLIDNSRINK